ncbi:3-oxoadipate enol-lactonase [Methylocapsa polymorpha]|uniref:3-oxoadipate enol-lactonase n=1 Tax=Methylocapsa polymorpha TaxID=3080828 RepID=A0ABZ0HRP4_9HYPH|nr:3-oxoadipate enol-lactonase [Methylocapsa sp. RX1]
MTEITVAGETFNILVEGDETKPVLMISNPLGVNLRLWDRQAPAFLEHFRVLRYDSRGHGASVADEGPYSIAGLAQDALAILDALDIERAHWLGLSKGGMVGQWLLAHARERMGRAVLANTAAQIPSPDLWNERIQAARDSGLDALAEGVAERWFTKRFRETEPEAVENVLEMLRQTPLQGYTAAAAAIRDADQREIIRTITNPVLVIVGRHDPSTPPGLGALVASSIEGAQLATLEASHISNIEDAENFTKTVIDFLTASDVPAQEAPPRRRAPAKKAAAKKAAAKKAPVKKAAAQKAPVKKAAVKKAATKKASAKKTPAKKASARKAPAKKTPVKKAAAKKAVSKKIPAKKAAAKKSVAKTTTSRRTIAKKAAPKKAARRTKR